jgi:hypothetical protein
LNRDRDRDPDRQRARKGSWTGTWTVARTATRTVARRDIRAGTTTVDEKTLAVGCEDIESMKRAFKIVNFNNEATLLLLNVQFESDHPITLI